MTEDVYTANLAALEAEEADLRARLEHPDALHNAAQWFASIGQPVIPLHHPIPAEVLTVEGGLFRCSCQRPECGRVIDGRVEGSPAKHPLTRNGLKDATTDPNVIRAWWKQWPEANLGILTGVIWDVIDLDGPPGNLSYAELRHATCAPNCCAEVTCPGTDPYPVFGKAATPRGRHIYIRPTGRGNHTRMRPGIDYRGNGGYVLAPPSRGISNLRYIYLEPPVKPT